MGEQQNYAIIIYELIQRLSNEHEKKGIEERIAIIQKYVKQL